MSGSGFRVPPYAMTGGRTRSEVELTIEQMLTVTESGKQAKLSHESARIAELCTSPLSVAEISAHLKVPLQVAKILAGDMVAAKHLTAGETAGGAGAQDKRPDIQLLNRVLDGLQSL